LSATTIKNIKNLTYLLTYTKKQKVILPEFDKINVIKEQLNVKYDFASVPVLNLADIVYSIELLCIE